MRASVFFSLSCNATSAILCRCKRTIKNWKRLDNSPCTWPLNRARKAIKAKNIPTENVLLKSAEPATQTITTPSTPVKKPCAVPLIILILLSLIPAFIESTYLLDQSWCRCPSLPNILMACMARRVSKKCESCLAPYIICSSVAFLMGLYNANCMAA